MIKLFRKIRYNLMEQNKTGKYLKYAIGEIILVVIGILIALQINNWNEDQKSRRHEVNMLKEINKAITDDIEKLNLIVPYFTKVKNSYVELTRVKNGKEIPQDSLNKILGLVRSYGYVLSFNKGPYESLKSNGLDKISDIETRNLISALYGNDIPIAESFINEVLRVELYKRNELINNMFGSKHFVDDNKIDSKLNLFNLSEALNSKTMEQLISTSWPIDGVLRQFTRIRDDMQKTKDRIKLNINNSDD